MSKIGPNQGQSGMYELDVHEHVPLLCPADYGASGASFDAKDYFITSGDAVSKCRFLLKELEAFAASITDDGPWRDAVVQAVAGVRTLIGYLVAARGPQIFLETEYLNRKLFVIPKDPRRREAS